MRKLVHSLFGHNNLVPFHFWGREIVLKSEKIYQCYLRDCAPITHIQDGGQKRPPISFFTVTSTNVGISPKNFLIFSFSTFSTLV